MIPVTVKLPAEEFTTGYGDIWSDNPRDTSYYLELAEKSHFEIVRHVGNERVFFTELKKS